MKGKRMPRRKKLLLAGGIVLLVLAVLTGAFFWYVSDYYPADEIALEVLAQDSTIEVQDDLTILSPSYPTDTAVIFYPGAKVEAEAGSAPAGADPADRRHLHPGPHALPHGDL